MDRDKHLHWTLSNNVVVRTLNFVKLPIQAIPRRDQLKMMFKKKDSTRLYIHTGQIITLKEISIKGDFLTFFHAAHVENWKKRRCALKITYKGRNEKRDVCLIFKLTGSFVDSFATHARELRHIMMFWAFEKSLLTLLLGAYYTHKIAITIFSSYSSPLFSFNDPT